MAWCLNAGCLASHDMAELVDGPEICVLPLCIGGVHQPARVRQRGVHPPRRLQSCYQGHQRPVQGCAPLGPVTLFPVVKLVGLDLQPCFGLDCEALAGSAALLRPQLRGTGIAACHLVPSDVVGGIHHSTEGRIAQSQLCINRVPLLEAACTTRYGAAMAPEVAAPKREQVVQAVTPSKKKFRSDPGASGSGAPRLSPLLIMKPTEAARSLSSSCCTYTHPRIMHRRRVRGGDVQPHPPGVQPRDHPRRHPRRRHAELRRRCQGAGRPRGGQRRDDDLLQ